MLKKAGFLFLVLSIVVLLNVGAFGWGGEDGCGGCGDEEDFDVKLASLLTSNDEKVSFSVDKYEVKQDGSSGFKISGIIKNNDTSETDFSSRELNIALINKEGISESFHVMQVDSFKYGETVSFEFYIKGDASNFSAVVNYIFSKNDNNVNLSKALSFDDYKKTAMPEELATIEKQFASSKISDFFIESIKKINTPMILLMIGLTSCIDCSMAYPYMEAITVNPLIKTIYFPRDTTPGARRFTDSNMFRTNVPAILIVQPDGHVLLNVYSETPERVTDMLRLAKNKEEQDVIWKDFHSGVYNKDIEHDILKAIEEASEILE